MNSNESGKSGVNSRDGKKFRNVSVWFYGLLLLLFELSPLSVSDSVKRDMCPERDAGFESVRIFAPATAAQTSAERKKYTNAREFPENAANLTAFRRTGGIFARPPRSGAAHLFRPASGNTSAGSVPVRFSGHAAALPGRMSAIAPDIRGAQVAGMRPEFFYFQRVSKNDRQPRAGPDS